MPQDPCVRTASPQPVSSTRRRLSTDEMRLREVGKLAVHLWKIRWLQKPSQQALLRELCGHWMISLWDASVFCEDASPLSVLHPGQGQPLGQPGGRPAVYPVAHVELLLCRGI